jgi:hypothetical protein
MQECCQSPFGHKRLKIAGRRLAQAWHGYELADLRAQAAAEGGSEADVAGGPGARRLIWRQTDGPLRVRVAGLQRPPGGAGSGGDLLVSPPHLQRPRAGAA